jgi:glycosyltransferase involved in cell wall biosynthesis
MEDFLRQSRRADFLGRVALMSVIGSDINIVIAIDHASITGGQAKVALDSALGLKRAGYNPIVFAAVAPVDPRLVEEGVEVICLDQPDLLGSASKLAAAVQGTWNFRAERELRRLLSRLRPERTIVHVHGWAKALSASIARPIRRSGLPCVYTMHEYFMFCPNGGFYDFQSDRVCGLTPLSAACWARNCDSRNYPFKLWRNARLAVAKGVARIDSLFDDIVLISQLQEEALTPYLPASARRHRLGNPIDAEALGHKSSPASGDLLFVGRLSPEKGVFLFAEAARLAGVTPVFAGDGPAAAALRATYPEARLLGWKSASEVKALLRNARALVFPSLWFEGQPLTVLEAKAMGAPSIVSDGCAARESIEDGVTGLWFKSGDAASLASALRRIGDNALAERLSRAAYDDFWRDPPTLEAHVAGLGAIYEQALRGASTPRS